MRHMLKWKSFRRDQRPQQVALSCPPMETLCRDISHSPRHDHFLFATNETWRPHHLRKQGSCPDSYTSEALRAFSVHSPSGGLERMGPSGCPLPGACGPHYRICILFSGPRIPNPPSP